MSASPAHVMTSRPLVSGFMGSIDNCGDVIPMETPVLLEQTRYRFRQTKPDAHGTTVVATMSPLSSFKRSIAKS